MQALTQLEVAQRPLQKQELEHITNGVIGPQFCVLDITVPILLRWQMMPKMLCHGHSAKK